MQPTTDIPAGVTPVNINLVPSQTNNIFAEGDHVQITQDQEEDYDSPQNRDPSIQMSVCRQMERKAEQCSNDKHFDSIVSHEWKGSGLNLCI